MCESNEFGSGMERIESKSFGAGTELREIKFLTVG